MTKKRVLIVDDDKNLVHALTIRLSAMGLDVISTHDGMTAIKMIPSRKPDLIVLDVNMPACSGMTACAVLSHDPGLSIIPIIILTGRSDRDTMHRCEELGAHYLHKSTDVWEHLQPLVADLLELNNESGQATPVHTVPKVLIIDDDADICKAVRLRLQSKGLKVICAFNGMQGFQMALSERPDVIISDFYMPNGRGNYVLGRLRSHSLTKDTPFILLTGKTIGGRKDFALERDMIGLGAAAFLTKPINFEEMMEILGEHIKLPKPVGSQPVGVGH